MLHFPKDPLFRVLIVLLLVWPPLHAAVMPAIGVSTWRLGGWGMYATASPAESRVAVIGRDCVLPPHLLERQTGIRGLVLGEGSLHYGALALGAQAHDHGRDLSAFRWAENVLDLDAQVRRDHRIDPGSSLAIAITQPRIELGSHTAFGLTTVFVVAHGSVTRRERSVASLEQFDDLLPSCPEAP